MLNAFLKQAAAVLWVVVAFVGVGCDQPDIPPFSKSERHRSATQTLIVANLTESAIRVIPTAADAASITIEVGKERPLEFIVVTRFDQDSAGAIIAGSEQNHIESTNGISYFRVSGEDWVLSAGPVEESWEHALFFGQCWFNQPAEALTHRLEVSASPMEGFPVEICP